MQAVETVFLRGRLDVQEATVRPEHRIEGVRRAQAIHWAETALPKALKVIVVADLGLGGGDDDGGRAGTDARDSPDRCERLKAGRLEGQLEEAGVEVILADEGHEAPGWAGDRWCRRGGRGGGG